MNYTSWKVFIDAAELGSFSKVALFWNISQPQVSRHIQDLEKQCGGRLFQRNGRGVELTDLGKRLAPKIRGWILSTEQLENDIRETSGQPIGKVSIGILPSTSHPWISNLFFILRQKYPLIQLVVREGQGAQLETWLEQGKVDLAILYRQSPSPKNGDIYLLNTSTYLVGHKDDPLTFNNELPFSALDGIPLTTFCRPSTWRDRLDELALEYKINLNVILEADSLGLQAEAVEKGNCYALLGPYASYAAENSHNVKAVKIIEPEISRYIALAMSPHGSLTLACKTVMELVKDLTSLTSNLGDKYEVEILN